MEGVPGGGGGCSDLQQLKGCSSSSSSTLSFTCLHQMSAALILLSRSTEAGPTRSRCGSTFLPQSPRRVSTERAETGPDRTGSPCVCDVFRVQQQRERSAASVMSRPGKRSFQAALIFLSVAHLTAGTARGDRGATTGDRGRKQQEQKQVLS